MVVQSRNPAARRKPRGSVPDPYKRDQPAPWRPARAIPPRGKGKALVEFLRRCAE